MVGDSIVCPMEELISPDVPSPSCPIPVINPFSIPSRPASENSKRFLFNEKLDFLLLKACMTAGNHVALWGKTQELFEKTLDCTAAANKKNSLASGISEKHGELETLLDDIIQQINEKLEDERTVREEKSTKERCLTEAEEMRERAVKRQRRHISRSKSPTVRSESDSDSESKLIFREMEARRVEQEARRRIDEERLDLEKRRLERDDDHRKALEQVEHRRVDIEERRTALEEKRFDEHVKARVADAEERELALQERKALIRILGVLAQKLDPNSPPKGP
eukprot:IDg2509t1